MMHMCMPCRRDVPYIIKERKMCCCAGGSSPLSSRRTSLDSFGSIGFQDARSGSLGAASLQDISRSDSISAGSFPNLMPSGHEHHSVPWAQFSAKVVVHLDLQ